MNDISTMPFFASNFEQVLAATPNKAPTVKKYNN